MVKLKVLSLSTLSFLYLLIPQFYFRGSFSRVEFTRLLIIWLSMSLSIIVALYLKPVCTHKDKWFYSIRTVIAFITGLVVLITYLMTRNTLSAWILFLIIFILVLQVNSILVYKKGSLTGWLISIFIAFAFGTSLTAMGQIEARFSEEEFYVAFRSICLGILWVFMWLVFKSLDNFFGRKPHGHIGITLSYRKIIGLLFIFLIIIGTITIRSYQQSFYATEVSNFDGITEQQPFLCGKVATDDQIYNGQDVYQRILELLEKNQDKQTAEYGMLTINEQGKVWSELYKETVLRDARMERYTEASNSVKYSQFIAAVNAYFYAQVKNKFPNLFNSIEERAIKEWFKRINQRALTIEWIDWFYAIAYSKLPSGPFENQDIGAGLLAILEFEGLADLDLTAENDKYLSSNPRGWELRFRNTDDTLNYQQEWIYNAYFQSLFSGTADTQAIKKSFDWLLLQALPDGGMIYHNHPVPLSQTGISYLGATLLGDEQLLWLSGRSAEYFASSEENFTAVPGINLALDLTGRSPSFGSCLIFGDSGLPNQKGPLAPDKIVFRDGWHEDSKYLHMNLRFSGWHRYKGNNTITLIYKAGSLITERLDEESWSWLPAGRKSLRDKRIPREYLNGLIIPRSGMDAVIYQLTGIGGPWAQDPPYYATVTRFETNDDYDISHSEIINWHGWSHQRVIYFYHHGPIIILDEAQGPEDQNAAINWYPIRQSDQPMPNNRIPLRDGNNPVEMVLIPGSLNGNGLQISELPGDSPNMQVKYDGNNKGEISLITIFLFDDWVNAQVSISSDDNQETLMIQTADKSINLPRPVNDAVESRLR
jgi:hypothetical protein